MTPFFQQNLTSNAPYFCSPVGTCTSLSYSSAPPQICVTSNQFFHFDVTVCTTVQKSKYEGDQRKVNMGEKKLISNIDIEMSLTLLDNI